MLDKKNLNNPFDQFKSEENNFKLPPKRIEKGLKQNMGTFRMIGNVVEMFLPRIFQLFVSVTGGNANKLGKEEKTVDFNHNHPKSLKDPASDAGH